MASPSGEQPVKLAARALARGLCRRCPQCGKGALFARWAEHLASCSHCGLVYERNPGDTWAFTIIGDRLPVAVGVVAVYLGVFRYHRWLGIGALVLLAALIIWTAPNRWGAGIALHYLSRLYFPDESDPVQPPTAQS
jgi:uncharacterized protein (DUF983 family)